jgi:hypothetical protein
VLRLADDKQFRAQARDPALGGWSGLHKVIWRDEDGSFSGSGIADSTVTGMSGTLMNDENCDYDERCVMRGGGFDEKQALLDNCTLGARMMRCDHRFQRVIVSHSILKQGNQIRLHDNAKQKTPQSDVPWITGICQDPIDRWTVALGSNRAYEFDFTMQLSAEEEKEQTTELQAFELQAGEKLLLSQRFNHDCKRFDHSHIDLNSKTHASTGRAIHSDPFEAIFRPNKSTGGVATFSDSSFQSQVAVDEPLTWGGGGFCFEARLRVAGRAFRGVSQIAQWGEAGEPGSVGLHSAPSCAGGVSCADDMAHYRGELMLAVVQADGQLARLKCARLPVDTWLHLAVCHDGTAGLFAFVDGVRSACAVAHTDAHWGKELSPQGDVLLQQVNSSGAYGPGRAAWAVSDGVVGTYWDGEPKALNARWDGYSLLAGAKWPNQWLVFELQEPAIVNRYTMMTMGSDCPTEWTFEGSAADQAYPEDARVWDVLDQIWTNPPCVDRALKTYNDFSEGDNVQPYPYYMMRFSAGCSVYDKIKGTCSGGKGIKLRELQLFVAKDADKGHVPPPARKQRALHVLGGKAASAGAYQHSEGSGGFGGHYTDMTVDAFRFWDRVLSEAEARALHSTDSAISSGQVPASGLLVHHGFDQLVSLPLPLKEPRGTGGDCVGMRELVGGSDDPQVTDAALTVSSWTKDKKFSGRHSWRARMNNLGNAWRPAENNQNQWLQVDFPKSFKVAAVQTRGEATESKWVTSYRLKYQARGVWAWHGGDEPVVLSGNSDKHTLVTNMLAPTFDASAVRIVPVTWANAIALRLELLTCATGHDGLGVYPAQTLVHELGAPSAVARYALTSSEGHCPAAWRFEGANAASLRDAGLPATNWTLLDNQVLGGGCLDGIEQTFNAFSEGPSAGVFRFYRWRFSAAQTADGSKAGYRVAGVKLYADAFPVPLVLAPAPVARLADLAPGTLLHGGASAPLAPRHFYAFRGSGTTLADYGAGAATGEIVGGARLSSEVRLISASAPTCTIPH